jgi:glyceraldehyde 3-phosphate dehydrogenase
MAVRVPTATVSMVDFVAELSTSTTAEEINATLKAATTGPLEGILGYTEEPLVSTDLKGDSRSSIVDGLATMVLGGNLAKIIAWYDNEWAYAVRSTDIASMMARKL